VDLGALLKNLHIIGVEFALFVTFPLRRVTFRNV
jgi:hypothetical protein